MDDVQVYWSPRDCRWFRGCGDRNGMAPRVIPGEMWLNYLNGFRVLGAASGAIWEYGLTNEIESVTLPEYATEREV